MEEFNGKKLLILGANPETVPLVEIANQMGVKTIVTSNIPTDAAKKVAWKACDFGLRCRYTGSCLLQGLQCFAASLLCDRKNY